MSAYREVIDRYNTAREYKASENGLIVDGGTFNRSGQPPNQRACASYEPAIRSERSYDDIPSTFESDSTYGERHAVRRRGRNKYSNDSGVSECKQNNNKGRSEVRRRKKRCRKPSESRVTRSHSLDDAKSSAILKKFEQKCDQYLKQQQEKIDEFTAICQQCLYTVQKCDAAGKKTSQQSTDLTTSLSSMDLKPSNPGDQRSPTHCRTYKLILRKLEDLNKHFKARAIRFTPPASAVDSSSSSDVSVCNRGIGTVDDQGLETRYGNNSPTTSVLPMREAANGVYNDNYRDLSRNILAGTSNGEPFNLDDPIQLYEQAKRMRSPFPQMYSVPQSSQHQDICTVFRGYITRLRASGGFFCKQVFCCAESPKTFSSTFMRRH